MKLTVEAQERCKKVFDNFSVQSEQTFSSLRETTKIPKSTLKWMLNNIVRSDYGIMSDDNTRRLENRKYKLEAKDINLDIWMDAMNEILDKTK